MCVCVRVFTRVLIYVAACDYVLLCLVLCLVVGLFMLLYMCLFVYALVCLRV